MARGGCDNKDCSLLELRFSEFPFPKSVHEERYTDTVLSMMSMAVSVISMTTSKNSMTVMIESMTMVIVSISLILVDDRHDDEIEDCFCYPRVHPSRLG